MVSGTLYFSKKKWRNGGFIMVTEQDLANIKFFRTEPDYTPGSTFNLMAQYKDHQFIERYTRPLSEMALTDINTVEEHMRKRLMIALLKRINLAVQDGTI